jgi:hypothetical protein
VDGWGGTAPPVELGGAGGVLWNVEGWSSWSPPTLASDGCTVVAATTAKAKKMATRLQDAIDLSALGVCLGCYGRGLVPDFVLDG